LSSFPESVLCNNSEPDKSTLFSVRVIERGNYLHWICEDIEKGGNRCKLIVRHYSKLFYDAFFDFS
jgi:hypothetical protein